MASALAPVPLLWPDVDRLLEASGNGPSARIQRSARAAAEIVRDFRRLEGETASQLLARLDRLKRELLAAVGVGLADASPAAIDRLLRDVDRLIAAATTEILGATARPFAAAAVLGEQAATQPVRALQVTLPSVFLGRGLDDALARTAEDNTLDLLSPPMRQFASDIRTSIRRVAVAGGQRMEEIQRLQKSIAERGIDQAAFRAERIVRTELGRVFGEATFARLEDLARTFSFLKKAWKATNDRRTRLGHREAGQTYGRGKGIPIAERFQVPVYEERGKAGAKRVGVAALRFPVDPLATPAGRLAAASTILCRCHAVVDVDVARYADFARAQVQVALGGPLPPPVSAPPAPAPVAPTVPAPAPRVPRPPRVARPRVVPLRPADQSVAQKLQIPRDSKWDVARAAMNAVEQVHGDGPLSRLPLRASALSDAYGFVIVRQGYGVKEMGLTSIGFRSHPHMTLWHETGHWLDYMAVAKGGAVHPGRSGGFPLRAPLARPGATRIADSSAEDLSNRLLDEWRAAVSSSQAVTTMQRWLREPYFVPAANGGSVPNPARPGHARNGFLDELLTGRELFARSYAQWIAIRSQHPTGLEELQRLIARPTIDPTQPYLRQWSEADFAPIARAFDRLFALLGWRLHP